MQNETISRNIDARKCAAFFPLKLGSFFRFCYLAACKRSSSCSATLNTFQFEMVCLITHEKKKYIIITLEAFFLSLFLLLLSLLSAEMTPRTSDIFGMNFLSIQNMQIWLEIGFEAFSFRLSISCAKQSKVTKRDTKI